MEYVWIPKARSSRKSRGCLQNPKWAFGGKLTDENAWRTSVVGVDNINERLMKINVRRN
ncbi:MAG: hypothetical protein ACTS41_01150 [Candidatus Hodgkinia cicadicola]